jgi:lambda repressor-like predicted transcriptional regulator
MRKARGLPQIGLAVAAQVSPSVVNAVEKWNHRPTGSVRECLAEALGVEPVEIWPRAAQRASRDTPAYVGRAVAALAADRDVARWNGQSLSSGQLAKVYGFTDHDGSQPDAWRYMVEVQEAGKPSDVTGYR